MRGARRAGCPKRSVTGQALEERQLPYVVQVKSATSVLGVDAEPELRASKGRGRPPVARYHQRRSPLRELALTAGEQALSEIVWREGSRGQLRSRFLALRVRPANVKLRPHRREQRH